VRDIKTLLIWPPITVFPPDTMKPSSILPLGLSYIAAFLEKNNHDVKILDALALGINNREKCNEWIRTGLNDREIKRKIKKYNPDIVGISSMFTAYSSDMHNCAKLTKEVNPDIPVIVGGAHASVNPEMILKDKNIDIVVKGEGEHTILDLVERLEKGKKIYNTVGTIIRKSKKIFQNPPRPYIKDLDSIPFPARHLLPMDIYLKQFEKYGEYVMRQPKLGIVTSRGCPGKCVFCSIHSVWGHKWRGRSAKNVVDEIEYLVNKYKIREFSFSDDNFSLDKNRTIEICDEINKRKLDIKWCTPNGVALWTLDKEIIKKMRDSGCYRLTFGIESGNYETQKFIGKTIKLEHAKSLIQYANRIGLWTISTFIIGFPLENKKSIEDTIKYAIECDTDLALFYILGPFPGTPVYEIARKENLLKGKQNWGYLLGGGGYDTKIFTAKELREWQSKASSKFLKHTLQNFLNPLRIARKIRSIEDLKYTYKIGKKIIKFKKTDSMKGDVKNWIYKRS